MLFLKLFLSIRLLRYEDNCNCQQILIHNVVPFLLHHRLLHLHLARVSEQPQVKCLTQDEDESRDKQKLHLTDKAEWQYSDREKENLEVFYTRTARGNRIACMFVKCAPNARFTILHSHGNAVDLGQMSSFYLGLGSRLVQSFLGF